jgi:hypothetical protein
MLKLVLEERESEALAQAIDAERPDLVAGWLLETEMRRAAQRVTSAGDGCGVRPPGRRQPVRDAGLAVP